jgi:maleate isomerase
MFPKLPQRYLLGQLTPSSNTVLEPICARILADVPEVTSHFSRFVVRQISLSDQALAQFDSEPIVAAARLLADAKVQAICWNGTAAGWLGFEADEKLCAAIVKETGIPACTAVLTFNEIFRKTGVAKFGLVSPYIDKVQDAIVANYRKHGWDCVAETHYGDKGNFSFSEYTEEQIAASVREVAKSKPDAITIYCTNMRGAPIVASLEAELGIPIYDSVAACVWKSMLVAGADPRRVKGWGRLFSLA